MGEKMPFRARNPEATRADILASARAEFAKAGLSGARVDKIAENSGANYFIPAVLAVFLLG